MTSMRLILCALWLAAGAGAQESRPVERPGSLRDATEILRRADQAARAVNTVRYRVQGRAEGLGGEPYSLTGLVTIRGGSATGLGRYRMELELRSGEAGEARKLVIGSNGQEFWRIDERTRKVHVGTRPDVLGDVSDIVALAGMQEFVHPEPFKDELEGRRRELAGLKEVGGEECYEITVQYADERFRAVWCFSTRDFLPRRVVRSLARPGVRGATMETTVEQLEIAPVLDPGFFDVPVPEEYTRTDESAP